MNPRRGGREVWLASRFTSVADPHGAGPRRSVETQSWPTSVLIDAAAPEPSMGVSFRKVDVTPGLFEVAAFQMVVSVAPVPRL
ncbi:protein of unknown function [Methylocella tundrae]|uniref:Uncharacterized protein n=1 Tax=Methylocella tundrae TaxID=227605 RepID=A0A4U8Z318_METTU|nr:protein of unknown function [Methylocella tundrae]